MRTCAAASSWPAPTWPSPTWTAAGLAHSHADRYPEWVTVRELAWLRADDTHTDNRPDVEATRRAVRALEAAELVESG